MVPGVKPMTEVLPLTDIPSTLTKLMVADPGPTELGLEKDVL